MDVRNKAVISDDLTGAMDAGVGLLSKGLSVNVIFDLRDLKSLSPQGLIILDTESRNIPVKSSYDHISRNIEAIRKSGLRLVYKKVDSTLRGNLGGEISAILDMNPELMIALAPALPYNGRKTIDGYQYVGGRPLTESDISKDPFSSVDSSYIPELLARQSQYSCGVIHIADIRLGAEQVAGCAKHYYDHGVRITVLDIESDKDFETVLTGMKISGLKYLPCGSAGMLSHIFGYADVKPVKRRKLFRNDNPVLIVSGSPAAATKHQISMAKGNGIESLSIAVGRIVTSGETRQEEFKRLFNSICSRLSQGKSVILDGAGEGKENIRMQAKGDSAVLYREGSEIRSFLASLTENIIEKIAVSGLMVIGGDTAMGIFHKLGAFGIRITGEVEPYVPSGRLLGGKYHGLPVVTKAGGFGSEMILPDSVNHLKGK